MDRQPHPFSLFRSSQPLVPVTLFFISGIVAGSYQWLTSKLSFPLLIVPVFFLILGIRKKLRFNFLLICIIFFLLGAILSSQQINPHLPQNHIKMIVEHYNNGKRDDPGISIEGVLSGAPEIFSDKTRLHIDAERVFTQKEIIPVRGKILITVGSPSVKVKYGDRIRFIAKLSIPRNFGNPGEFDYAGNLAREGIYVTGHVESGRWIAVIGDEEKHGLRTSIEQIRDKIRDFIDGSGAENRAIVKALILGETSEISKSIRNAFAGTGTAHILAISGLHIGIIAFVSYWIILKSLKLSERLMLAFDIRKIAAASSILPVLLYGAIAGFSVSTQRAVIMVFVFILSVLVDREKGFYNTLAAAALVILVISPLSIYDISFQLSFASVLAIIYLVSRFQRLWKNEYEQANDLAKLLPPHPAIKPLKNYLVNPFTVSVAASIGTAPFIAWHFHRVSIIGILANIIAVPLMGFIAVPLGLISSLASFFYLPLAGLTLKLSDIILKVALWVVDMFASLPYASVYTTTPTILEAVLLYLLIICIVEFKKARFFKYGLATVILVLIGNYSYWYYHLNYNPNLKVTFISVGQGDSALVEFPYGKRMLIDGRGFYSHDFDVGERIIAPFLWKNKIDKIDHIILSHPQSDHMKGLKFITEKFGVHEFLWNGEVSNDRAYTELMRALDKNNIKKLIVNASIPPLDINGVKVEFLNPPADSHLDTNNKSLIVRLSHKNASFLFTGDIEAIGEMALLKRNENIHTAILKVPHHGSRTSSTIGFLKAVNPELAVISLGYSN
ncbi:MAG: DNA internalization-related competence protein ComEC/Rec2, partial [Deltaproteobacteria bacterium]|nr:DNA internalization-related competence protein ComEC/Rec2 [Deltaproteobacteria bacterium]